MLKVEPNAGLVHRVEPKGDGEEPKADVAVPLNKEGVVLEANAGGTSCSKQ